MEIISIESLFKRNLSIPKYQRPYKWQQKNISDLLDDISNAIEDRKRFSNFKYRIGTIILNKNNDVLDIVDGQQRVVSLLLIMLYLDGGFTSPIASLTFSNKETLSNLHSNYAFIKNWFSSKNAEFKSDVKESFSSLLEVVVFSVDELSEAFQLFDSQNTRGKHLDPHDLLKAYHLRAMRNNPYEMRHMVTMWESVDSKYKSYNQRGNKKSFDLSGYGFDSIEGEMSFFKRNLFDNNDIKHIWFTGMLTNGQSDFYIHYIDPEAHTQRSYYPDFLVEMQNGQFYIVETKGEKLDIQGFN